MAMSKIVDWDQLYPGRFWKAGLLAPDERKVLLVTEVQLEELETDKGAKQKGVLTFEGEQLQLPLNKTNGICLREMFGRVPFKWVGRRFAIFASVWANEPCIRIWGSPELERDLSVTIELPRKKPFVMVMHAMGGAAAPKPAAAPRANPLYAALMTQMGAATTPEELDDAAAEIEMTTTFTERETSVLHKALARRRVQIEETERADQAAAQAADDIPF